MKSHDVRQVYVKAGEPLLSTDCLQILKKFFRVTKGILKDQNKALESFVIIVN